MESPIDRSSNDPADDEMLVNGVDGPGVDFDNGGNPIVLGVECRTTAPRQIKGIRYWRATSAMPVNATGRLYKVTGQSPVAGTDTHNTEDAGQGGFAEGATAFPGGNGNGANYWVDVIATPIP